MAHLTATAEPGNTPPRVLLTVDLADQSPVPTEATITRSDSGGVVTVRSASPVELSGGLATLYDYEMPFGEQVTYELTSPTTTRASLQVDTTGAGEGAFQVPTAFVVDGTSYDVSVWVKGTVGNQIRVETRIYDWTGAYLGEGGDPQDVTFTGGWQQVTLTGTHSGIDYRPGVQLVNSPGTATQTFYVDNLSITQGGGANLADNPQVTYDTTGWDVYGSGTIARSTSEYHDWLIGVATVTVDDVWLRHVAIPDLSVGPVDLVAGSWQQRTRATRRGRFQPLGRRHPIVVTSGARASEESTLLVHCATESDADAILDLVDDETVLLLGIPASKGLLIPQVYVSIGDVRIVQSSSVGTDHATVIELPCTVVERPEGGIASQWTLAELGQAWATIADVGAAYATLLDVGLDRRL